MGRTLSQCSSPLGSGAGSVSAGEQSRAELSVSALARAQGLPAAAST